MPSCPKRRILGTPLLFRALKQTVFTSVFTLRGHALIPNLPSPDPLEYTNLAASPDLGLIQPSKCLSGEYLPSLTLSSPKEGIERLEFQEEDIDLLLPCSDLR